MAIAHDTKAGTSESAGSNSTSPEPEVSEIESRIVAFIERDLLSPGMTVEVEDDLLSGDVLDSVAVLRLASYVEEEFRIGMQPSDFVVENFQNVAVLARYVRKSLDD